MTRREKEIMGIVTRVGKATPRQIGEILSITSGYAEQLCNMMTMKEYLVKIGKFFAPAEKYYEQFSFKTAAAKE